MREVINHLKSIPHKQILYLLDEKHNLDSSAGIIIVNLPGEVISSNKYIYHFHGARILTGDKNFVKPIFIKLVRSHIISFQD